MRFLIFASLFFLSCTSNIKRNMWVNQYEVCCVMNYSILSDGTSLKYDSKTEFFEDGKIKIKVFYDVIEGVKISFMNKTSRNAEIVWEKSYYIDETGKKIRIVNQNVNYEKLAEPVKNELLPPYQVINFTVIPVDRIYYEDGVWHFRPLLSFSKHPQEYIEKPMSLKMLLKFSDTSEKYYTLEFNIKKRYSNS